LSAGRQAPAAGLKVRGEAGLAPQALHLRNLHLSQAGRQGQVTGQGLVQPVANGLGMTLSLAAQSVDLAPELGIHTALAATLTLQGGPDRYQGELQGENQAAGPEGSPFIPAWRGPPGAEFRPPGTLPPVGLTPRLPLPAVV
jgi:hypothetical protein